MVRREKTRRIVQGYGSLPILKYGFGSASIRMRPRMAAIATASVRLSAPELGEDRTDSPRPRAQNTQDALVEYRNTRNNLTERSG
jgi:hypothetical protein